MIVMGRAVGSGILLLLICLACMACSRRVGEQEDQAPMPKLLGDAAFSADSLWSLTYRFSSWTADHLYHSGVKESMEGKLYFVYEQPGNDSLRVLIEETDDRYGEYIIEYEKQILCRLKLPTCVSSASPVSAEVSYADITKDGVKDVVISGYWTQGAGGFLYAFMVGYDMASGELVDILEDHLPYENFFTVRQTEQLIALLEQADPAEEAEDLIRVLRGESEELYLTAVFPESNFMGDVYATVKIWQGYGDFIGELNVLMSYNNAEKVFDISDYLLYQYDGLKKVLVSTSLDQDSDIYGRCIRYINLSRDREIGYREAELTYQGEITDGEGKSCFLYTGTSLSVKVYPSEETGKGRYVVQAGEKLLLETELLFDCSRLPEIWDICINSTSLVYGEDGNIVIKGSWDSLGTEKYWVYVFDLKDQSEISCFSRHEDGTAAFTGAQGEELARLIAAETGLPENEILQRILAENPEPLFDGAGFVYAVVKPEDAAEPGERLLVIMEYYIDENGEKEWKVTGYVAE